MTARTGRRVTPRRPRPTRRSGKGRGARLAGSRVWLVGASSGIGAALARRLRQRGAQVAITARRRAELELVSGGDMAVVPADVGDREQTTAALASVCQALGGVDTVIWCAGHWRRFDAATWDADSFQRHVEVNLLGLNNVLAAVVPLFVAQGAGHVVGIASVAGYRGVPGAEAYGATKAAQINALEAARGALASRGIRVTTVNPGFVRTPMTAGNAFPMPFLIEPDQAARAIVAGLELGRMEIVFPLPMAVVMKVARVLPVRLWAAVASRLAREG